MRPVAMDTSAVRSRHALRADIALVLVLRGIVYADVQKGVVTLAALAASAAVDCGLSIADCELGAHARQRELEWDAQGDAPLAALGLARAGVGGVDLQIVGESERERPGHRRTKLRRRIRKRVVGERTEHDAI